MVKGNDALPEDGEILKLLKIATKNNPSFSGIVLIAILF